MEWTTGLWKRSFSVLVVATAVLHNFARKMHDELPELPVGINIEELNYLIDQAQIPEISNHHIDYNFRNQLVNNFLEICKTHFLNKCSLVYKIYKNKLIPIK